MRLENAKRIEVALWSGSFRCWQHPAFSSCGFLSYLASRAEPEGPAGASWALRSRLTRKRNKIKHRKMFIRKLPCQYFGISCIFLARGWLTAVGFFKDPAFLRNNSVALWRGGVSHNFWRNLQDPSCKSFEIQRFRFGGGSAMSLADPPLGETLAEPVG